jgi:hypothetical protein
MKYFTPDLFVRLQDLQDRTASKDWEKAVEDYDAYLRRVRPRLPRSLRRIVEDLFLHDAEVLCMSRRGNTLSVTLQLEPPAESLLVLNYSLVADLIINRSALPADVCTDNVAWLHDEIKVERPIAATAGQRMRKNGRESDERSVPVYSHTILLSNGWEVEVRFRGLRLSRPKALIPCSRRNSDEEPVGVPRSA